jgi:flagellar hook-length control protein FliK
VFPVQEEAPERPLAGPGNGIPAPAVATRHPAPTVTAEAAVNPAATPVGEEAALLAAQASGGIDAAGLATADGRAADAAATEARPAGPLQPTSSAGHAAPARSEPSLAAPMPAPTANPSFAASAGPGLGDDLGQRILWLSGNRLRGAEIQLDPPELGALQVQVHAHRDGASVHFVTQTAAARDAVEASLPRLREMLENSGLNLLDVNVAHQQERGGRGAQEEQGALQAQAAGARLRAVEQSGGAAGASERVRRGLVDDYA